MGSIVELSHGDARRVALWRQGFLSPTLTPAAAGRLSAAGQERSVHGMVRGLGAVQLDTISVLARSHELVAYSRFGNLPRGVIEAAYWGGDTSFEYWSHAACILPIESWPLFTFRRRHYARKGIRWHEVPQAAVKVVLARLAADGPLTTKEIGGAKKGGEWWDWSESKVAVEYLLDIGKVACTSRIGWRRVYELADRVVPIELREHPDWSDDDGVVGPSDEACLRALITDGARTVGVGTSGDIADVHRLTIAEVERHAADAGLVRVHVPGWPVKSWATQESLDWLAAGVRATHRTTLLSPFDSLVWHRGRTERLFGMAHRLEAYTPAAKRVCGYFAMPVLHKGALVARVDPRRDGQTLVASTVTFEADGAGRIPVESIRGTAVALREAARWVGCGDIRLGTVMPPSAEYELSHALNSN
ncbi:MAG: winged helix-turn-helix domain-containing protein [Actinobacteria bacterium]|nr:winged helix-turn-helix domain-containing protein [Actinomycetota bacterium]